MPNRTNHNYPLRPRDIHMVGNADLGIGHGGKHPAAVLCLPAEGGADVVTGTSANSTHAGYGLPGVFVHPDDQNGLTRITFFEATTRRLRVEAVGDTPFLGRLSQVDRQRIREVLEQAFPSPT